METIINIPRRYSLILYDPTDRNIFGGGGLSEAKAVADHRGIPHTNIIPLPTAGDGSTDLDVPHDGTVIVISHGTSASGFKQMRLRKGSSVTGPQFLQFLEGSNLFTNRVNRVELLVCKAASGNDTFAQAFHSALVRNRYRGIEVKGAVGFVSIDSGGGVSVSYFAIQDPNYDQFWTGIRSLGHSLLRGNHLVSWLWGDWYVYPNGTADWST